MEKENPVRTGVDCALAGVGFKRKSSTWYRELDQSIQVLNIQRSSFGDQHYINLGVFVKGLNELGRSVPKENECHVRMRLDDLVDSEQGQRLKGLLNLEDTAISFEDRQSGIAALVGDAALSWFCMLGTVEQIRQAYHDGQLAVAIVDGRLKT